ncbi:MAG TPA: response regulator [Candidatus Saccharimonadales bacterium]|nr:response regulator [Candidatus Saccharimonadales bacterium]
MDPNAPPLKVVIVEDNAALADIYKTRLELIGYQCQLAYDGQAALATIQQVVPDLVLLDLMVPKIAGDQILATMRATDWGKNIKVQIISNLNEADAPAGLRDQGIVGYAVKANLTNDALDKLVDSILKPEGQTEDVSLENKNPTETLPPEGAIDIRTQPSSGIKPIPAQEQSPPTPPATTT